MIITIETRRYRAVREHLLAKVAPGASTSSGSVYTGARDASRSCYSPAGGEQGANAVDLERLLRERRSWRAVAQVVALVSGYPLRANQPAHPVDRFSGTPPALLTLATSAGHFDSIPVCLEFDAARTRTSTTAPPAAVMRQQPSCPEVLICAHPDSALT
jgi:hypothetical protein